MRSNQPKRLCAGSTLPDSSDAHSRYSIASLHPHLLLSHRRWNRLPSCYATPSYLQLIHSFRQPCLWRVVVLTPHTLQGHPLPLISLLRIHSHPLLYSHTPLLYPHPFSHSPSSYIEYRVVLLYIPSFLTSISSLLTQPPLNITLAFSLYPLSLTQLCSEV